MNTSVKIVCGVLLLFLLGCQEPGTSGLPFEAAIPPKLLNISDRKVAVEAICSLDVAQYNPLNIKDYVFAAREDTPEIQFFNYAVLEYGYFTKDPWGYIRIALTPALQYVLDNNKTYIKPLRQRGIQVLLEIRSGDFDDQEEEGDGIGMGTLDMAAIDELVQEFKLLINRYGIDGFELHDIGGGKKAYPPFTRNLKQFQRDAPLYDETLFQDNNKNPINDPVEVDKILWKEGGSNFSNLIQRTNEHLKETYTVTIINGNQEESRTKGVERSLLVRDTGHGGYLLDQLREAYLPDAYSGANAQVSGNLKYIVHGKVYDFKDQPYLWNYKVQEDKGKDAINQYAPFGVDLADPNTFEEKWTNYYTTSQYGALYFVNLPPKSERDSTSYLTDFSLALFGRVTSLAGTGDYRKTW